MSFSKDFLRVDIDLVFLEHLLVFLTMLISNLSALFTMLLLV